jgi:hypothetical protein
MNTILGFTAGVITTMLLAVHIISPTHTITRDQPVIIRNTTTVIDTDRIIDLLRNTTNTNQDLDDDLYVECLLTIERHTHDPLEGIVHYIHRYWHGDACAAAAHQAEHGWY